MTLRSLLVAAVITAIAGPAAGKPGAVVRVEHRDPRALPSRGPNNALVTIEVFLTPGPASRHQAVRLLERLQSEHPSRIRLVYRIVKGGATARLHYAAIYAYNEGKFFEFLDAVGLAPRALDDAALLELGKKVGLDPEALGEVIKRPPAEYDEVLEANERRRRQKMRGNPSLPNAVFNGIVPVTQLSSLTYLDLQHQYEDAKDLAEQLLDHGIDQSSLGESLDQIVRLPDEIVVVPGPMDEETEETPSDGALEKQPLPYAGLPSHGPAEAPVTIAVLCSPVSQYCAPPLGNAQRIADLFPERVRVVWAPYYNVTGEDAADLAVLSDAALCAERDGGRSIDRNDDWDPKDSPGWRWVREVQAQAASRSHHYETEELIDHVVERLRVEPHAFASCRARLAGTSIAWLEKARRAGVQTSPATIVNGRIYGPINDPIPLQLLVEQELAPGLLAPAWTHPDPPPPPR